jgi:hypothetical protein
MFTQAGFNPRHRVVCHAMIARRDRDWVRQARLVRFMPSGEYAWVGERGVSWPEQVVVCTFRDVLPPAARLGTARFYAPWRLNLPSSTLYDLTYGPEYAQEIARYKASRSNVEIPA